MKGKVGKRFSLKKTPRTGLTIYAVMGKLNTKPENIRTRKHHGITTRATKEAEEKRYEYQHK